MGNKILCEARNISKIRKINKIDIKLKEPYCGIMQNVLSLKKLVIYNLKIVEDLNSSTFNKPLN